MSFLKVAKTVQNAAAVAQRDGIGSLFKRLHLFNTLRPNARLAGQDQFGNKYYEDVTGELQLRNRWVELNVEHKQNINSSTIPPEWHSWIHQIVEKSPVDNPRPEPIFQVQYVPTELSTMGTKANYLPPGYPGNKPIDIKENITFNLKRYQAWNPSKVKAKVPAAAPAAGSSSSSSSGKAGKP